jgi:hypothetical protein
VAEINDSLNSRPSKVLHHPASGLLKTFNTVEISENWKQVGIADPEIVFLSYDSIHKFSQNIFGMRMVLV